MPAGEFTDRSTVPLNVSTPVTLMTEIRNDPGVSVSLLGVADKTKLGEIPDVTCTFAWTSTDKRISSMEVQVKVRVEGVSPDRSGLR
jgi:hypothetical protein